MTPKIAPSILSADFARLADELASVSEADWIHVDVMDGQYVPNITIGPLIVEAARRSTDKFLDVHLMIVEPDRYLSGFQKAGADLITVHAEACVHLDRTIQAIKATGAKAGVALNPHTPTQVLDHVLSELDLVLMMTVNPGFGGQKFIERVLPKIEAVRERVEREQLSVEIEVDGGVKTDTARRCIDAGASVLVSGSGVFGASDRNAAIRALRGVVDQQS